MITLMTAVNLQIEALAIEDGLYILSLSKPTSWLQRAEKWLLMRSMRVRYKRIQRTIDDYFNHITNALNY